MAALWSTHASHLRLTVGAALVGWATWTVAGADRPMVALAGAVLATGGLITRPRQPVIVLAG